MDRIRIEGGRRLEGIIPISGAKNATLPLMIASLLTDGKLTLENVPDLADVALLKRILENHGVDYTVTGKRTKDAARAGETLTLSAERIVDTTAPYDLVSRMRASFWVIGPLLARMHEARVSLPGGCAIGTRPVDFFLTGLEALGATLAIDRGYVVAKAPGGLRGGRVRFPHVSVGATHTILMAATLARGETVIENAAREPEVRVLAECLVKMGARIEGVGTDTIRIAGVDRLDGAVHRVLPDRIETGTYAMAAAITDGDVELVNTSYDLVAAMVRTLEPAGVEVTPTPNGLRVRRRDGRLDGVDVMTEPFPGFPTDLQAQIMSLMAVADGAAMITETIFENRFMHVPELMRMGANINVHGASAMVRGVKRLIGAEVMATDLRASVSLVLAGLVAEGDTVVNRVYHLDRGYERVEDKLAACGAEIERLKA
jgi:UDP-N-acetylglucosamine 1-carboxyvinyltransferase